jgi:hypothetical protein
LLFGAETPDVLARQALSGFQSLGVGNRRLPVPVIVAELLQRNVESERAALGKIMALQTELASVRGTGSI